jgi:hypothetical protein
MPATILISRATSPFLPLLICGAVGGG